MWLQQERIPLVVLMILTAVLVTMFRNLTRVKLVSNEATYDAYTPQQRAELAKSAAAFKVFGNISSKLVSGSFNNGAIYSTAAVAAVISKEIQQLKWEQRMVMGP